ncbi:MAG: hypothetical protein ACD_65C00067G0004 [uncultured bacterium]|nr:MAG: hypothetical protein ACD_65C00067G0004 [uncultured bacterium]KKT02314.1 MAG: hypothetical protein UV80_C0004G0003 [Candidatus Peregrinibacteria bacterium GW2011_GWF2_43_17]HAU39399.1 hypothetical protein [Candidatus Peregrinibacteria bacterium]
MTYEHPEVSREPAERRERTSDMMDQMRDHAVAQAETVKRDNTVPEQDVSTVSRDWDKLNNFEKIALLLATILGGGQDVPQELQGFFLEVEDGSDAEGNVFDKKEAKKAAREYLRDSPEVQGSKLRQKVVKKALRIVGKSNINWPPQTKGGVLGCAYVASLILVDAGVFKSPSCSITEVVARLQSRECGWRKHYGPPKPGDVAVWERTKRKQADGMVALGHGHIGIVTGNNLAVSNSSGKRMPRQHSLNYMESKDPIKDRKVEYYLSPSEGV